MTSRLGRIAGVAGAAAGLVAAGAAAGNLAERRVARRHGLPPSVSDVPFGSLRGREQTLTTPDGVNLHVEVDESDHADGPTVVFVHGYALNLDSWHLQRQALRGRCRLVLYDHRSHGRSTRGHRDTATIEQLGRDLRQLLDEVVPTGRIVLVGHSMGGMTIMELAQQAPDLVAERVSAVALLATSAGDLGSVPLILPGASGRFARRLAPGLLATFARAPRLVESGRRAGSDLGYLLTERYAFGGDVPDELVEFADDMLSATPVSVIADFFPDFALHDRYAALSALRDVHTLVVSGSKDVMAPPEHSRLIAERLPSAELHELEGAGHLVLLERGPEVNRALLALIDRACAEEGR
jgi:pimeloyl-ACP methyl ester carboxylesterase